MPRPARAAGPLGWRGERSFDRLRLVGSSDRPFLHAREVVVAAVAALPHGQNQREIGLLLALESFNHRGELGQGALGMEVWVSFPEADDLLFARRLAALERDIGELGDGGVGGNAGKSAATQDRGLEGELRRHAGAHLRLGRYLSSLVVENGVAAAGQPLDAVGARSQ